MFTLCVRNLCTCSLGILLNEDKLIKPDSSTFELLSLKTQYYLYLLRTLEHQGDAIRKIVVQLLIFILGHIHESN